jgi:hypothetical protein
MKSILLFLMESTQLLLLSLSRMISKRCLGGCPVVPGLFFPHRKVNGIAAVSKIRQTTRVQVSLCTPVPVLP